jgi:hypothetical protein
VILVTPDRDSRVVVVVQEVVTQVLLPVQQERALVVAVAAVVFTTLEGIMESQPPPLTVGRGVMVAMFLVKIMAAARGIQAV